MGEAVKFYFCWNGQENLIGPNLDRFEWLFVLRKSLKCTPSLDVSFEYMSPEKERSGFGL